MSTPLDGLQFPTQTSQNKPSTSKTGREILAAAVENLDPVLATTIRKEKNWRKTYPKYFKAIVEHGIQNHHAPIEIAQKALQYAHQTFEFYQNGKKYPFSDVMKLSTTPLQTNIIQGESDAQPEWYVPYQGKKLQGTDLLNQLQTWQEKGVIEASHADALREVIAHPEWLDLSDRMMVLFGAASEAGPLTWLAKWKANIIAVDLQNKRVWNKILTTIKNGNATLYAPSTEIMNSTDHHLLEQKLGANLLSQTADIAEWLISFKEQLDLAAIAYLDGEKHVRVALAMDAIMQEVSQQKSETSLMFMCTPTDVYAVPKEVIEATQQKSKQRTPLHKALSKGISTLSMQHFFQNNTNTLYDSNNGEQYGIADCLVLEQGPNYALAKRLQQFRAVLARQNGQKVSINIAPSTTTHSVVKNPLLKAAFNGASLFDVEAFEPETTNALMAALWIYDLRHNASVANPQVQLKHPLELIMSGANHGGLWRVAYLARTALPFAALYGMATDKLPNALKTKFSK